MQKKEAEKKIVVAIAFGFKKHILLMLLLLLLLDDTFLVSMFYRSLITFPAFTKKINFFFCF